ncbi:type II toxin-antitoxin system RelE/ParE family toxin [Zooshikella marina]|uniref:Toxin n=1 Tax=Zooshikella ganghwensis TaxID=202772 RepID=A0A4V1IMS9_9GAMM|nr:type II toxin-antitoxin system RelE/ParE family toxin [Zooshikella ganghwensis]MBU2708428.1 type II toxin-antitoxin system RelE/ParE family toxin [Zooshikella ganghwensis]RDH41290.1 type II toxin-antitoxin system RelE/ParE family toxin [Zooshikella ganghwensis]RDH41291.1 type II toxin-antitoxin system RelE/ParE family toxin [Zooshikella ganghwensis]
MSSFKFTAKAEVDLESIVDYTREQWGQQQVHQYLDGFMELCGALADRPSLGLRRDSLSSGLRSFPYESHILYYQPQSHGITVVRVLHKRRDPVKHL